MRRFALAGLWLTACYSPSPSPGAACGEGSACPDPLVCSPATNTCEKSAAPGDSGSLDDAMPDGAIDVQPPPNDQPTGAIDVTGGGSFDGTFAGASDDAPNNGCGGEGGAELFYSVKLDASEVYAFDTLGSIAHTAIRVFPGKKCQQIQGMDNQPLCSTFDCGERNSQIAASLPADRSCIVVDAIDGQDASFQLHVTPGGRDGVVLSHESSQTYADNTCMHLPSQSGASCATTDQAGEVAHALLVCPGTSDVDADTCVDGVDNIMYLLDVPDLKEQACYDDGDVCTDNPNRAALHGLKLQGPAMYWIVVDGFGAGAMETCGPYTLTVDVH